MSDIEEVKVEVEEIDFNHFLYVDGVEEGEQTNPSVKCLSSVSSQSGIMIPPRTSNNVDSMLVSSNENRKEWTETNCFHGLETVNKPTSQEPTLSLTVFSDESLSDNDSDSYKSTVTFSNKVQCKRKPGSNDEESKELQEELNNTKSMTIRQNGEQRKNQRNTIVECEVCGRSLLERYLKEHLRRHGSERSFGCETCFKRFKTKDDLKVHIKIHIPKENIVCSLCKKTYSSRRSLKDHEKLHSPEPLYNCRFCNRGFNSKFHLKVHENEHTAEKVYVCEVCNKNYISYTAFASHKKLHKDEMYICNVCARTFRRMELLKNHQQTHNKDAAVNVCNVCGKNLSTRASLTNHTRIHTGEKPYVCEVCGKCSRTQLLNAQHMKTHTGEKPYACPFCRKRFAQRTSLVIHQRSHTGERPYKCERCPKTFSSNSSLNAHHKKNIHHSIVDD